MILFSSVWRCVLWIRSKFCCWFVVFCVCVVVFRRILCLCIRFFFCFCLLFKFFFCCLRCCLSNWILRLSVFFASFAFNFVCFVVWSLDFSWVDFFKVFFFLCLSVLILLFNVWILCILVVFVFLVFLLFARVLLSSRWSLLDLFVNMFNFFWVVFVCCFCK